MDHGNILAVAIDHTKRLMLAAVGMFRQLLDAHMDRDLILVYMESSVKNQVLAIDKQLPRFQQRIASKIIRFPKTINS